MVLNIEAWTCSSCKRKDQRLLLVDNPFQKVPFGFSSLVNFLQIARLKNSRRTCLREVSLRKNKKNWLSLSQRICIQWHSSQQVFWLANQAASSHRPTKMESTRPNTGSQLSKTPLISAPKPQELLPLFITTASVITPRFQTEIHLLISVPTTLTCLVSPTRTSGSSWDSTLLSTRKLPLTYF